MLGASADAAAKTDTVAIRVNVHPVKDAAGCIVGACIVAVDRETIVFRRGTMWDVVADHAAVLKISLTSMPGLPGLRQKRVTSGDGGGGEGGDRRDVEEGDGYVGGTVLYQSKVASTLLGLEDGSSAAGPTKAILSDIHPEWELQRLRRGKVYEEMVRLRPGESIGNVSHFTACGQCDVVIAKDPVDPAPFVYWMLITPQVKSPTSESHVLVCIVVFQLVQDIYSSMGIHKEVKGHKVGMLHLTHSHACASLSLNDIVHGVHGVQTTPAGNDAAASLPALARLDREHTVHQPCLHRRGRIHGRV